MKKLGARIVMTKLNFDHKPSVDPIIIAKSNQIAQIVS